MSQPLRIAVVGHTNTGKTSLMRTLLRNSEFGDVQDSASTTRHVESSKLIIDNTHWFTLIDTPGLEDPMGLIDALDAYKDTYPLGIDRIHQFLVTSNGEFEQESKVLKQLLECDIALYVIDSRETVLGKYQDELSILTDSAKPIMPILNFVADEANRQNEWREYLAKRALHAVVSFDTVAYQLDSELALLSAIQALLPKHRAYVQEVILARERTEQTRELTAAQMIADLLVDVTAWQIKLDSKTHTSEQPHIDLLQAQDTIRQREKRCIADLLALFAFSSEQTHADTLDVEHSPWTSDLFNPNTLLNLGLETGSAAAKGATVGLTVDVFTGGASLGVAALVGAGLGMLAKHAKSLTDSVRGYKVFRADMNTLTAIALRQTSLVSTLRQRGHASQAPIALSDVKNELIEQKLNKCLKPAFHHPNWSSLNGAFSFDYNNTKRTDCVLAVQSILCHAWQIKKTKIDDIS